ncbi:hypothetical protein CSV79_15285 [Sporosarcina sp. P13]|uniref:TRAP transporter small permease n=1 Tax=Sporosarcina sp. P13 TaxID=2048263 RepID=UPI000C1653F2|nr:TRAP transporter small permease [Sporosarcina sp. P13]PIC62783.1 hypothetical protein CSV79_15285 [Sporosarcina sp. P13]
MNVLFKSIRSITNLTKWLALVTMSFMALFITFTVTSRAFGAPILGDVELVQTLMVVLIMFGLAYSQSQDAHISIGLIVDRFSVRVQLVFDVFGYLLTCIICLIISGVFIGVAVGELRGFIITTDLLSIPLFPFKFIIAIGFFLWGMEALLRVILSLINLKKTGAVQLKEGSEE